MKVGKCCNGSGEVARRLENAAEAEWWAHEEHAGCKCCRCCEEGARRLENTATAAKGAHEGHEGWKMLQWQKLRAIVVQFILSYVLVTS